jgi:hypothetical protein
MSEFDARGFSPKVEKILSSSICFLIVELPANFRMIVFVGYLTRDEGKGMHGSFAPVLSCHLRRSSKL